MKFHVRIWTEFGKKRDKLHVKRMSIHLGKRLSSFTHKRTFLSTLTVMNKKSQPKLNTHNEECLVKFSDQKTQGIGRSKTQTESEQNRFSENKMS